MVAYVCFTLKHDFWLSKGSDERIFRVAEKKIVCISDVLAPCDLHNYNPLTKMNKDKILPTIQDNGPIVLTWEGLKLEFLSYYFTGSKLYTSEWWWSYSAWNILQGSHSLGGQGCVGICIFTGLLNIIINFFKALFRSVQFTLVAL